MPMNNMKNNTRKNTKGFGWACSYGTSAPLHSDNEQCDKHNEGQYKTMIEAAQAALIAHPAHSKFLYVFHHSKGYMGLAEGLNFGNRGVKK